MSQLLCAGSKIIQTNLDQFSAHIPDGTITEHNFAELLAFDEAYRSTISSQRLDETLQMTMGWLAFQNGTRELFVHNRLSHVTDVGAKGYLLLRMRGLDHRQSMFGANGGFKHDDGHMPTSHSLEELLAALRVFDAYGFRFNHDDLSIILAHLPENREIMAQFTGDFRYALACLIGDEYIAEPHNKWRRLQMLFQYLQDRGFPLKELEFDLINNAHDLEYVSRSDIRFISQTFHDDADTMSYIVGDFMNSFTSSPSVPGITSNFLELAKSTNRVVVGGKEFYCYRSAEALRGYWVRFSRLYTDVTFSAPLLVARKLLEPALGKYLEESGDNFPILDLALGRKKNASGGYYGCRDLLTDLGMLKEQALGNRGTTALYPHYVVITWPQGLNDRSLSEMNRLMSKFGSEAQPFEFPETVAVHRPKFGRGREFLATPEFLKRYQKNRLPDGSYLLNKEGFVAGDSFRITVNDFGPWSGAAGLHRYYISNLLLKRVAIGIRHDVDPSAVYKAVCSEGLLARSIELLDAWGKPLLVA